MDERLPIFNNKDQLRQIFQVLQDTLRGKAIETFASQQLFIAFQDEDPINS